MKLPRDIITIWLSHAPTPPQIEQWTATHNVPGYSHKLITLANIPKGIPYVDRAIANTNWIKASDYYRVWHLWKYGGIYLDADIELTHSEFLNDLTNIIEVNEELTLICEREPNGFIANSFIMAHPGAPYLKQFLDICDAYPDAHEVWNTGCGGWTFMLTVPYDACDRTIWIIEPGNYFKTCMNHHFSSQTVYDRKEINPGSDDYKVQHFMR